MTEEFFDLESDIDSVIEFSEEFDKEYDFTKKDIESKEKITYIRDGRPIVFDDRTEERYRVLRLTRQDPITDLEVDKNTGFKFEYQWDPYTGEILGKDPHGPLWFNPDILIKHFYTKRLYKLWVDAVDSDAGYFEGHYDDAEGAGEDFYIKGLRDKYYPEWYLFRLPIIDCYLTKDYNPQIITLGPKLTDDEIAEIDTKAKMQGDSYRNMFGYNRPSLVMMKTLYDQAITKEPRIEDADKLTYDQIKLAQTQFNRQAIDKLKTIRG